MGNMNRVMLMGNLTRDPELKQVQGGTSVCELGMAMTESYKNKAGEQVEKVCYVDIVVWGKQAESCGQHLHKGSSAFVEGSLQFDQWEKDGQKRNKLRVRAITVHFLGQDQEHRASGAADHSRQRAPEPAMAGSNEPF